MKKRGQGSTIQESMCVQICLEAFPLGLTYTDLSKRTGIRTRRLEQVISAMTLKHDIAEDDDRGVFLLSAREKALKKAGAA
jgi:hypothetical protein